MSRVITYINVRLLSFHFSLQKDIFNYRDISYILFFNCGSVYFLINIYLDFSQMALKYLKDTEANINNILITTRNFNIRNNIWDPLFPHYLIHSNTLTDITDSLNICLSKSTNQVPIRYMDNLNDLNLVINLMFLYLNSEEFNNHMIHSNRQCHQIMLHLWSTFQSLRNTSKSENRQASKTAKIKETSIRRINTDHIKSKKNLEQIVQDFMCNIDKFWFKHSKFVNITIHSKSW